MESLLIASFVAGFLTVLAPCLLPLLPVVIGGSLGGDKDTKRNPYVIIGSLLVSVVAFTLLVDGISSLIYVPQEFWRIFAATLVLFIGLTFLFPSIWFKLPFVSKFSISSNKALGRGVKKGGVLGDILIGGSLGPVFTSCSPTYFIIIATVLPSSFFDGLLYLSAYVVGLGVVLLFIALVGQVVIDKLSFFANDKGWFKRTIGVIMIVVALLIYTGIDKHISTSLLDFGFIDVTRFELEADVSDF